MLPHATHAARAMLQHAVCQGGRRDRGAPPGMCAWFLSVARYPSETPPSQPQRGVTVVLYVPTQLSMSMVRM